MSFIMHAYNEDERFVSGSGGLFPALAKKDPLRLWGAQPSVVT